jgi:hypothetical protein
VRKIWVASYECSVRAVADDPEILKRRYVEVLWHIKRFGAETVYFGHTRDLLDFLAATEQAPTYQNSDMYIEEADYYDNETA